jgi:hypothetical protein
MLPKEHDSSAEFAIVNARHPLYEVIDAGELARRWNVPKSWILEQTRSRAADPIPCLRMGKYVRFEWGSSTLLGWLAKRRTR